LQILINLVQIQCDKGLCLSMHNVQDEGLDVIAAGLTTLKDMAGDINEVRLLWCIYFYTTEDMLQAASRECPIQMDAKLS
jgi:hypothetical protein